MDRFDARRVIPRVLDSTSKVEKRLLIALPSIWLAGNKGENAEQYVPS
jgi:hypothetical protein